MRHALRTFGLAATLAAAAVSQVYPPSWIVADAGYPSSGLLRISPQNGNIWNFGPITGYFPTSVMMATDNSSLVVAESVGGTIDTLTALGLTTSSTLIGTTYGSTGQLALDQDGTVLCSTEWSGVMRYDLVTQLESYVWTRVHFFEYGMCVDGDSGDYLVVGLQNLADGRLYRVNRATGVAALLASGLGQVSTVDFDPLTGDFLVTNGDLISPLFRVSRTGAIAGMGMFVPSGASAARVDPETGNILVAGTSAIRLLSPLGSQIRSFPLTAGMYARGLEFEGSRKVSGSGPATAGSTYQIHLSFPGLGNRAYVVAMSTAMRPGIALNDGTGRVVSLANDWLLQASLGGIAGITSGFSGVLDSTGRATAAISIPPGFPAGARFFVSAVAFDAALPSGLASANTHGFTTN